jgi:hypothetical protein
VGSKFEGTGLEKLHMVQTHVAVVTDFGSGGGLGDASGRGEAVEPFHWEDPVVDVVRARLEERLGGFGMRVILAEDFKKPA